MKTPTRIPFTGGSHRGAAAALAGLLFLGLAAGVFAQTAPPAPVVDATTGPDLPAGLTPPVPYPNVNRYPIFAPASFTPAFKPGFGQAAEMRPTSGPGNGGAAVLLLPDSLLQKAMAGSAWAVKFLVQSAVKGDFVTRTARATGTGQFLFGASRTTGTARAVLYPNGATPLTVDGGAGPDLSDGKTHWLEVDCAAGAGGTSNYYVYGDGILAGSAIGAAAWSGPGTGGVWNPNGGGSGDQLTARRAYIGDTAFDAGQGVDYTFSFQADEVAFYTAALHNGEAFTPDAGPISNSAPHQAGLFHLDGDLLESNTNAAP